MRAGTPDALAAEVDLLRSVGVEPPERIESLVRRRTNETPGCALIGLFSRGKSTLFNCLVGAEVSAVGALPTTAIVVEAATGPASAWTVGASALSSAPSDPAALQRHVTAMAERPESVHIVGDFRLPAGLRLIDTPGVGAVSELGEQPWWTAPADAAVVVFGLPPGPQGEDFALLEQVDDVYGHQVMLVLKATSSDVETEDLLRAAKRAEAFRGRDIIVTPTHSPTGAWGQDPSWSEFEAHLGGLVNQAAEIRSGHDADIDRWVDEALTRLDVDSLPTLNLDLHREGPTARSNAALERLRVDLARREAQREESARLAQQHREQRAAERLQQGDALLGRLHRLIASGATWPLSGDAIWTLDTATSWVSASATDPPLAGLSARITAAATTVRTGAALARGHELLQRANSLYSTPILDPAGWTNAVTALQHEVHALLTEPVPSEPEVRANRDRLATWYTDVAGDGGRWSHASVAAVNDAVQRERLRATAAKWLLVLSVLCFFGGIAGGCVGSVMQIGSMDNTYDPVNGYQTDDTVTADDPGGSTVILSILAVIVSFPLLLAGLVMRYTRREWTQLYRAPPLPKADPGVGW